MVDAKVDDLDEAETGRGGYAHKLSNPVPFLWTMLIFLILPFSTVRRIRRS